MSSCGKDKEQHLLELPLFYFAAEKIAPTGASEGSQNLLIPSVLRCDVWSEMCTWARFHFW